MSQPSVSLAIKELENYYGVKLFDRMNRTLYITEKGRLLLEYAENILSEADEAYEAVSGSVNTFLLRVGANLTMGENYLPKILDKYHRLYPDVDIRVTISNSKAVEELISSNKLDIGFIDNVSNLSSLKFIPIINEEMCVFGKAGGDTPDEITLSQLSTSNLLLREKGSGIRSVIDHLFRAYGYDINPKAESISTKVLIDLTCMGMGYTILPDSAINDRERSRLKKINIRGVNFTKTHYFAYHVRKFMTIPMENMINMLNL